MAALSRLHSHGCAAITALAVAALPWLRCRASGIIRREGTTMQTILLVGAGGAIGALLRYIVSGTSIAFSAQPFRGALSP
jgi:hypothetical protein